MNKTQRISIGIFSIVIVLVGLVLIFHTNTPKSDDKEAVGAQPKLAKPGANCATSNPNLNVSIQARSAIEFAAVSHIVNVPAGTNVDVLLASYTTTATSGAVIYPKNYGTYNFSAVLDNSSSQPMWKITSFAACKKV